MTSDTPNAGSLLCGGMMGVVRRSRNIGYDYMSIYEQMDKLLDFMTCVSDGDKNSSEYSPREIRLIQRVSYCS